MYHAVGLGRGPCSQKLDDSGPRKQSRHGFQGQKGQVITIAVALHAMFL